MPTINRKKRKDMNPLERSIASREGAIGRMKENINRIRSDAAEKIAEIQARIKEKQFLLDALKRGQISA